MFVITVDGRPVATLGPYLRRQWVPASAVAELLRTPADEGLLADLAALDDQEIEDPWDPP